MARTFPRTLLEDDLKSDAERRVFEALRDQLPDEWSVFHSAGLIYRDHASGAREDESDFVLCCPGRAIVCLEVKGGGLECRLGEWFRLGRDGEAERMRDPFTQAADHKHALRRKLEEEHGADSLFIVHAVAFPDIPVHKLALAPDAPREIVLDRNDLADVPGALERVLAFHAGSRDQRVAPTSDDEAMLEEVLAPTYRIEVPLATVFEEEERQLAELTEEQAALLNRFGRDRRMVVAGCAGSGKTMLAVERARRLVEAGRRVLFVCFNKSLANHIKESTGLEGLDAYTFHGLCVRLAGLAGTEVPRYDGVPPLEFWTETLPNALLDAVEVLGGQYDDILVDEAQDLESDWLAALTCTLRDEQDGSIWLFMDDNQRVYGTTLEVPPEYRPFDLTVNCRNTQAIHNEVMKLYRGSVRPEVRGPRGRPPELIHADDQAAAVQAVLDRLCGEEDVKPRDVVVLSGHGRERSAVYNDTAGRWRFTDKRGRRNQVFFSSIRAFKGLEAPVVILCELDSLDEETRDSQLYVGLSRARNHCVVVVPGGKS